MIEIPFETDRGNAQYNPNKGMIGTCNPSIYNGYTLLSKGQEFMTTNKVSKCNCINKDTCLKILEALKDDDIYRAQ